MLQVFAPPSPSAHRKRVLVVAPALLVLFAALGFAFTRLEAPLQVVLPGGQLPGLTQLLIAAGPLGFFVVGFVAAAALVLSVLWPPGRWLHHAAIASIALFIGVVLVAMLLPLQALVTSPG